MYVGAGQTCIWHQNTAAFLIIGFPHLQIDSTMGIWCFLFFWSYTAIVFMFHNVNQDTDLGGNAEAFLYTELILSLNLAVKQNYRKTQQKGFMFISADKWRK